MKQALIILTLLVGMPSGTLSAQSHERGSYGKMLVFALWAGSWQGDGTIETRGEIKAMTIDQTIKWKLDESVLLVERTGRSVDEYTNEEVVVHDAFGIVAYDALSGEYSFKLYSVDDAPMNAWFKVIDRNEFLWGFDTPRGHIRHRIHVDQLKNIWNEIGEFSKDGRAWRKFFEMNLVKAG